MGPNGETRIDPSMEVMRIRLLSGTGNTSTRSGATFPAGLGFSDVILFQGSSSGAG